MPTTRRYFKKHLTPDQIQVFRSLADDDAFSTDVALGDKSDHDCAVVFFDLCNFTNISWTLPRKEVLDILQNLFQFVSRKVYDHHGMIDKYPGDGVVAFFPRYYGNESDEIVEYALDCIAEVMFWFYEELRWEYSLPRDSHTLELSVGIDAGTISIAHVGSDYHSELILLGNQVNCASKCQAAAIAKEVVVGQDAARRVRRIYSKYFSTGPSIDVIYAGSQRNYLSHRFDWKNFGKESSWIEKP